MDITNKWLDYLIEERKLAQAVIQRAGLYNIDDWLVIPIKDCEGNVLFNKYRRAPWMPMSWPKYRYDIGSTASLYGVHFGKKDTKVIICEGELDVLAAQTAGYFAISSTGGASTFREYWLSDFIGDDIYLWLDTDDAGIRGATKIAKMVKNFTYLWTQPAWGKDINDLLMEIGPEAFPQVFEKGVKFELPDGATKAIIRSYRQQLSDKASEYTNGSPAAYFIRAIIAELSQMLATPKRTKANIEGDTRLERAKSYPIDHIIEVRNGFATHCPFHNPHKHPENSQSFRVYHNNSAFCFGACQKHYDAIDIYCQVHGVDFKTALAQMNYE